MGFIVEQTSEPEFDVKLDVGTTIKEAKASAIELANVVYASAKTNDAAGQTFKNELMFALMAQSGRCRQAAEQVLGVGKAKKVIGETLQEKEPCCK